MPLQIHCPHCHLAAVVQDVQIGTVVSCPTCMKPFTVPTPYPLPSTQAESESPFEMEPPSNSTSRRSKSKHERSEARTQTLLLFGIFFLLLTIILGGLSYYMYDGYRNERDKNRMDELIDKFVDISQRMDAIPYGSARYNELNEQRLKVAGEHDEILSRHLARNPTSKRESLIDAHVKLQSLERQKWLIGKLQ